MTFDVWRMTLDLWVIHYNLWLTWVSAARSQSSRWQSRPAGTLWWGTWSHRSPRAQREGVWACRSAGTSFTNYFIILRTKSRHNLVKAMCTLAFYCALNHALNRANHCLSWHGQQTQGNVFSKLPVNTFTATNGSMHCTMSWKMQVYTTFLQDNVSILSFWGTYLYPTLNHSLLINILF